MGRNPVSQFSRRDSDHGAAAFPPAETINREGAIIHHPVSSGPADPEFSLHIGGSEEPIIVGSRLSSGELGFFNTR